MRESSFVFMCKKEVIEHARHTAGVNLTEDDVYVVWQCKALQNYKALLYTSMVDSLYYEVTYNGNKQEFYVSAYKKVDSFTVII